MTTTAENLIRAMWREIEKLRDLKTGIAVKMPDIVAVDAPAQEGRFSNRFPVLDQLDTAIALAKQGPLAALAELIDQNREILPWSQNSSYTQANCSRSFLDGYAYAGLSGPEGPLYWMAPRTGIMLMGSEVLYPGHHHEPREIYLLLTPGSSWRLDGGDWFDVTSGDLIYHDSWQMHEMRTAAEPMLAIAAWIEPGDRTAIEFDPERRGAVC